MVVALTGGGTLGHVIPALVVAKAVRRQKEDVSIIFIGSQRESEKRKVEQEGIPFYPISSGKLRRYFSLKNFFDVFKIIKGFFQARKILKSERVDVLFSKGGYVSVPVVYASRSLKIPCVSHESDLSLGLANRLNARQSEKVCLGFPNEEKESEKYIFTGNPVRDEFYLVKRRRPRRGYILVLGGSLGSREINELIWKNLDELLCYADVIHQTGTKNEMGERAGYKAFEFIDEELPDLMMNASLIISRAGANAVSEILTCKSPALLLPLSASVSRGDQVLNANYLKERGAVEVLKDKDNFMPMVLDLLSNEEKRSKMIENMSKLTFPNSAEKIAEIILNIRN